MGEILPSNEFASYVRYTIQSIPDGKAVRNFLLQTTYLPGAILRKAFELDSKGAKANPIPLNAGLNGKLIFPDTTGKPYADTQVTGIPSNTIVYVPNFQDDDDRTPMRSYDGVIDLQDSLNAHETQIDRILEGHADPAMYADEQTADNTGNLRSRQRVFFKRPGEDPPGYIVRDLQLDAVMAIHG